MRLVIIIGILLFAGFIIPIYAHDGNHTETRKQILQMDWKWPEQPLFCLFEPKEKIAKSFVAFYDLVSMIEYARDYWVSSMKWAAPAGNWDIDIKIYQDYEYSRKVFKEYPNCDVYTHFELPKDPDTNVGGFVKVQKDTRVYDEMVIVLAHMKIYEDVEAIQYDNKATDVVQETAIHEFGHALQLGHYAPTVILGDGEFHQDLMNESYMFGQSWPHNGTRQITDRDVISMLRQYGDDGWGGFDPPFTPYIIFPIP